MAKITTKYICQSCGYETPRWVGKCPECGAFGTFAEEKVVTPSKKSGLSNRIGAAAIAAMDPQSLSQVFSAVAWCLVPWC
jgi:predicted ATP-dependent serine protease